MSQKVWPRLLTGLDVKFGIKNYFWEEIEFEPTKESTFIKV